MKKYKGYLIDLDGTTYFGKKRIPTAEKFINELIEAKQPLQFVTNNATKTVDQVVENLNKNYDIKATSDMVYTSTLALIDYLIQNHKGQTVYCVGEEALKGQLKEAGITLVNNANAEVVVQALNRQVDYDDLTIAIQAILKGANFIVTNTDRVIPTEDGCKPSSGALTAFIQYATRVEPVVMGKPFAPIIEGAVKKINLPKESLFLIGDNYDTDIQSGIKAGIDTLLVLTGVTKSQDVSNLPVAPTYVVTNLAEWEI